MPRNKLSPLEQKARHDIATNIFGLMRTQRMTQKQLSEITGIPASTLSGYTNEISTPNAGALEKIAAALHVNKSDIDPRYKGIYQETKKAIDNVQPYDVKNLKRVPIIGTIACGDPIDANENIEEYRLEYFPNGVPSGTLVDLVCQGDSMEPTIPDGSIVVIRLQSEVETGEIAAVLVDGDTRATLKRVKYMKGKVVLWPENPKYDPILLDQDNPGRIIGKAIQFTAPL